MKATTLAEQNGLRTYLLVMDKGDEAFHEITSFAQEHGLSGASLTAIGAGDSVTLGYFDAEQKEYRYSTFEEQVELASCIGDIAEKDGKPALHAHIVVGRRDSTALAGHLKEFHVFPTMEVVLTETPAELRKRVDDQTGLALLSPPDSQGAEAS